MAGVAAVWQVAAVGQGGIGVISCVSSKVCVAGDGSGQLLTSVDPVAGPDTWHVTGEDPGHWLAGLTCTPESSCVATDSVGDVLTTYDPGDPSPIWTSNDVNGSSVIWDVSCPTTVFCAAGDVTGAILTATLSQHRRPLPPKAASAS